MCLCGSCRAAWRNMRWKTSALHRRRLAARMLCISLVCAAAYLTQMFWQQGLVDAGLPAALVGVPLFLLMLADVPGALLAPRLPARLGSLFLGCGLAVSACTMLETTTTASAL